MSADYYKLELNIHSIDIDIDERDILKLSDKIHRGVLLSEEAVPARMRWGYTRDVDVVRKRLGDFFEIASSLPVATEAAADALRSMNLGRSRFFPLTLYDAGMEAAEDEKYFLINIASVPDAFDPEQSLKVRGPSKFGIYGTSMETTLAVRSQAVGDLDAFIDERFYKTVVISARLLTALKSSDLNVHILRATPCITI